MKKNLCVICICLLISCSAGFAQKTISARSEPTRLILKPEYKRGLPPNLFVELSFEDANRNNILEASEGAQLKVLIRNEGKGPAQNLLVKVADSEVDPNLKIEDGVNIPYLYPNQSQVINIPITANRSIESGSHTLNINITENFGYDVDPAKLVLTSLAYREPKLVFSGLDLVDTGPGTGAIKEDGLLQAGELVKVKIVVQNVGQNVARDIRYKLNSSDQNVYIGEGTGEIGDLAIGEVKEIWITLSPNKRVKDKSQLPVYLNLTNKDGFGNLDSFQLPIELDRKPKELVIVEVKADLKSLTSQVARFEYSSAKIKTNIGQVIDITKLVPTLTRKPDAIAIVIGVEKYNNFVNAPYAANDARIIKDYFKSVLGIDQVILFTDNDVSGFFFNNKFNPGYGELQKAVIKGKTDVFVFYSGHGLPSKDGSKVYLLPTDGRIEALESQGYNLDDLYSNLESLQAKSVTVFLDACFTGSSKVTESIEAQNLVSMKGALIKPKVKKPWENNLNFSVFTSSDFEETSLGYDESGTGLFTYFLCAGMQGKADLDNNGTITLGELSQYVIKEVTETSAKISGIQTPRFFGNSDYILIQF